MMKLPLHILACLLLSGCASLRTPNYSHGVHDLATWNALAARPQSSAIARTEVVKFLVDLEDGRRVWFANTRKYPVHYFFAREHVPRAWRVTRDHEEFNREQYHDPGRRFEMGSIIHYVDPDLWVLELAGGDTLSGERIVNLRDTLSDAMWIGDRLRFRAVSGLQERSIEPVRGRLPLVTSDEVFAALRYQPLTTGRAFGYLRLVRGPLDPATVRADQILVLDVLPEEIPVSAAVISREMQAPLGHIAILCATRGTPNMGLRDALERADLRALDGKLVALDVDMQDFSIRAATLAEAEAGWASRRPRRPQVPPMDDAQKSLLDVTTVSLRDARFAGAKAAQLGEVNRIGGLETPGGFVIPLSYYLAHLRASGAAADLAARLADPAFTGDAAQRARWLDGVRAAIQSHPVDAGLVEDVRRRMTAIAPGSRWILRSSTNAEDLAGFTGAGLYRSVRVKKAADDTEISAAIAEVWASVWLQGAFEERSWFRVDHAAVGMAILVQPFVDGAVANGVAITANPFTEQRPGYFINAQTTAGSVTGAGGNELPEQHLVYTYSGAFESELLTRSSRLGGAPLLGDADLRALTEVLGKLHGHFMQRWRGRANAVDVEFLIAGKDRRVVVLQARPYRVTYTHGQRLDDVAPRN